MTIVIICFKEDFKVQNNKLLPWNIDIISNCCDLWINRKLSIIAEVNSIKDYTVIITYCKEDFIIAGYNIFPCNIDKITINSLNCCDLWINRTSSIIADVYWGTKGLTIVIAYCKKGFIVARDSLVLIIFYFYLFDL